MAGHSQDHHDEWSGVNRVNMWMKRSRARKGSVNRSLQPWQPAALGTNSPSVQSSRVSFHETPRRRDPQLYNEQLDSSGLIVYQYSAFTSQAFQSSPISGIMNPEWYVQVRIHECAATSPKSAC